MTITVIMESLSYNLFHDGIPCIEHPVIWRHSITVTLQLMLHRLSFRLRDISLASPIADPTIRHAIVRKYLYPQPITLHHPETVRSYAA